MEAKEGIAQAKALCAKGGDWERKNRLKVYEAYFGLATRSFKAAADLFLESVATFTSCAPPLPPPLPPPHPFSHAASVCAPWGVLPTAPSSRCLRMPLSSLVELCFLTR